MSFLAKFQPVFNGTIKTFTYLMQYLALHHCSTFQLNLTTYGEVQVKKLSRSSLKWYFLCELESGRWAYPKSHQKVTFNKPLTLTWLKNNLQNAVMVGIFLQSSTTYQLLHGVKGEEECGHEPPFPHLSMSQRIVLLWPYAKCNCCKF